MSRTDLVLLHAPSVYDFREKPILFGPVSDVVPSTQVFEMYPIGFLTILEYLQRHGHSVRIVNVALRMLQNRRFDPERLIKSLHPVAFGLDLHWLVHAHGSLELAQIIKRHHPEIPVIFGGLSSSYYHQELIRYPQVDYVVRGDSTEEPLRQLIHALKAGTSPGDVPNLTWKHGGEVRVNPLSYVPTDMNEVDFDYRQIMRSSARHLDILGHLPFLMWLHYPIVAGLSCRGCTRDCVTCGGSASAYRHICERGSPAFRSPKLLARDMGVISRYINAPAIALGDIQQMGDGCAREFLSALAKEKIRNHVAFEFFIPPPREFLEMIARAAPNFNIQISPESHDEVIRQVSGKGYGDSALRGFIRDALELGCNRLDLFFMIGLPQQTAESVMDTMAYCDELLTEFGEDGDHRVRPFISPMAPFLDPGSRAFEDPARYGYRLFHRTLEEHRRALLAPSWKYTLNYETKWMSRDQLASITYEAALELNRLKLKHGLLEPKDAQEIEERIAQERRVMQQIDGILEVDEADTRERMLRDVLRGFSNVGPYTICGAREMNWPARLIRFNPLRVLRGALGGA